MAEMVVDLSEFMEMNPAREVEPNIWEVDVYFGNVEDEELVKLTLRFTECYSEYQAKESAFMQILNHINNQ